MDARWEVLALGCHEDDLALMTEAFSRSKLTLQVIDDPGEFARQAVARRPPGHRARCAQRHDHAPGNDLCDPGRSNRSAGTRDRGRRLAGS